MNSFKFAITVILLGIFGTSLLADGPGASNIGHRYTKGLRDLTFGIDYDVDIVGKAFMNDMRCTINAVRCDDEKAPCSSVNVAGGSTCYVCDVPSLDRYCIPDPDNECVIINEVECGAERAGTCAGGVCIGLGVPGGVCRPKTCGA